MHKLEQAKVHLPTKGARNEKEFLILTHIILLLFEDLIQLSLLQLLLPPLKLQ